ncbi:MAG: beta-ketoacyl-ACP synthase II [Calditrichaceae bacterium]|nr:beta-ketoacyl-ACP synthase II [Calditrichaceae bacterium]
MERRRVVITGIGMITPVGNDVEHTWSSLVDGACGVGRITLFDAENFATKIAAEVKNFNPFDHFEHKEVKKLDRFTQFALVSAQEAVDKSGLNFEKENRDRIGVIVGSGIGGMLSFEEEHAKLLDKGPKRISPFFIPQMISDIAAGHISMRWNLKGPNYATVSACATSAHSVGAGFRAIQYGDADIMVCGGAEATICPMGVSGFNAMKAISTRNDQPEKASRPFDLERDGFIIGEGAGIVILEELEHALARGAKIYAEMAGIGFTADAYHITQPAPGGEGAVRAMRIAVNDSGHSIEDVDYINAHGTSTPHNDRNETAAIKTLFSSHAYKLKVSSTKSMIGHLLGASGAVEAIITTLTIVNNTIPPTINYEAPDPDCDLNYVPNNAIQEKVNFAISNSFGFGGHNVCLAVKRY